MEIQMTQTTLIRLSSLALALSLAACFDSTSSTSSSSVSSSSTEDCTTMPAGAAIALLTPAGGETYKVGQSVTIRWKEDASKLSGVMPLVSKDSGKTWSQPLSTGSLATDAQGIGCHTWTWVIDSAKTLDAGTSSNSKVMFRIRDYNDATLRGTSPVFTVQKP
jgi:hypothetical protein